MRRKGKAILKSLKHEAIVDVDLFSREITISSSAKNQSVIEVVAGPDVEHFHQKEEEIKYSELEDF